MRVWRKGLEISAENTPTRVMNSSTGLFWSAETHEEDDRDWENADEVMHIVHEVVIVVYEREDEVDYKVGRLMLRLKLFTAMR